MNPIVSFIWYADSRIGKDVNQKVTTVVTRLWPAKFIQQTSEDGSTSDQEFQCCYLIGLAWQGDDMSNKTKEEAKNAEQSMISILEDYENRTRGDRKYFDPASCWVMASLVGSNETRQLQVDLQLRDYDNAGDTDSEADFEMDEAEDEGEEEGLLTTAEVSADTRSKSSTERNVTGAGVRAGGSGKLRTATDVLNRLRWDSAMDSDDYVVGYEDRFTGIKEKALEAWKSEQTDEEFIPQHRILYFKRKGDGVIVWDRRTRMDKVFGSGL